MPLHKVSPLTHPNNNHIFRRKSIRLKGYDYTQPGAYFITVVTRIREPLFGDVIDGELRLNDTGRLIRDAWEWIALRNTYVKLDTYILMPNHLHGIVGISEDDTRHQKASPRHRKPLGRLIGAFKTVSTKQVNILQDTPGQPLWQRGFYDRVIRNERERNQVHEYIIHNPATWDSDHENPDFVSNHDT